MTTTEFKLPDVGEGLEEAEIVEWLVAVGDAVRRDQPLVEILTDKSQTQLPSPVAGTITGLGFAEGDIAHVGQVLVTIDSTDSASPPADLQIERAVPATSVSATASTVVSAGADPASSMKPARPKASPAIRSRALEAGIDLGTIIGTGPGGRILEADLSSSTKEASRSTDRPQPIQARDGLGQMTPGHHRLRGIRRATAVAMGRSWEIPHIHGADELDATGLMSGRDRIRELYPERGARLTPLAFFVMAVAQALRRYPLVNATIDVEASEIIVHDHVNIGLAVATDAGLVVPVIDDADRMDLFEIVDAITRLGIAARDRSITGEQMRGEPAPSRTTEASAAATPAPSFAPRRLQSWASGRSKSDPSW